jgi:hypothetical protein
VPEQFFRYVTADRVAAWEAIGWKAISEPLAWVRFIPGARAVVIIEWIGPGQPKEPAYASSLEHSRDS